MKFCNRILVVPDVPGMLLNLILKLPSKVGRYLKAEYGLEIDKICGCICFLPQSVLDEICWFVNWVRLMTTMLHFLASVFPFAGLSFSLHVFLHVLLLSLRIRNLLGPFI
jgi:hypothetical protein